MSAPLRRGASAKFWYVSGSLCERWRPLRKERGDPLFAVSDRGVPHGQAFALVRFQRVRSARTCVEEAPRHRNRCGRPVAYETQRQVASRREQLLWLVKRAQQPLPVCFVRRNQIRRIHPLEGRLEADQPGEETRTRLRGRSRAARRRSLSGPWSRPA